MTQSAVQTNVQAEPQTGAVATLEQFADAAAETVTANDVAVSDPRHTARNTAHPENLAVDANAPTG